MMKVTHFINRRFSPTTRMITKASTRRNRSIQPRDFQMWIWWWRTISLKNKQSAKGKNKVEGSVKVKINCEKLAHLTCMLISHGGGAPSGIPRASFSSCDNIPGFISLSFTCMTNKESCKFSYEFDLSWFCWLGGNPLRVWVGLLLGPWRSARLWGVFFCLVI